MNLESSMENKALNSIKKYIRRDNCFGNSRDGIQILTDGIKCPANVSNINVSDIFFEINLTYCDDMKNFYKTKIERKIFSNFKTLRNFIFVKIK